MPGAHRDAWIEAAVLRNDLAQLDELLGAIVGERPEQHGIGDREYGRIGGQADSQNPDRRGSVARTTTQPAQRLANIGDEPIHAGTLRTSNRTSSRLFVQRFFDGADQFGGIRRDFGLEPGDYFAIPVYQELGEVPLDFAA